MTIGREYVGRLLSNGSSLVSQALTVDALNNVWLGTLFLTRITYIATVGESGSGLPLVGQSFNAGPCQSVCVFLAKFRPRVWLLWCTARTSLVALVERPQLWCGFAAVHVQGADWTAGCFAV